MFVFRKRTNSGPFLSGPFLYVYRGVNSDKSKVKRFAFGLNL